MVADPARDLRQHPGSAGARRASANRWDLSMNSFPCLTTRDFWAFIADNHPLGIHRSGYNGVASLMRAAAATTSSCPPLPG